MTVTADDVILTNIHDNGQNGIDMDVYVLVDNDNVLNQQALVQTVEVSITFHKVQWYNLLIGKRRLVYVGWISCS